MREWLRTKEGLGDANCLGLETERERCEMVRDLGFLSFMMYLYALLNYKTDPS